MSDVASRNPLGRMFNGAGRAGPRRLLVIAGGTVAVLGVVTAVWMRGEQAQQSSTVAKAPNVNALPGGTHTSPLYSELATRRDQEAAVRAAAAGESSVASMPGTTNATKARSAPAASPATEPEQRPKEAGVSTPAAPAVATSLRTAAVAADAPPLIRVQQTIKPDDNQTKAYGLAINALLAGWGGKAQDTQVWLRPEDEPKASGNEGSRRDSTAWNGGGQAATPVQPVGNAPRLGGRNGGQVLMPAGRGVYARTVLASNSDQGGPVVIEALSGPIAGDRMTGSFEKRDERLVVKLSSITLQDGTQQPIDALVTSPDTKETSVASDVDQRYLSRIVLPVAAAFVSGLGQAIAQSNTSFVASPLGGGTGFTHLNLAQQLGVGAGVAGSQFGAIVGNAAPKGPTVTLDANVNVGVVFLAPLIVGER